MADLIADVRYGLRLLIKNRGFTIAAQAPKRGAVENLSEGADVDSFSYAGGAAVCDRVM